METKHQTIPTLLAAAGIFGGYAWRVAKRWAKGIRQVRSPGNRVAIDSGGPFERRFQTNDMTIA